MCPIFTAFSNGFITVSTLFSDGWFPLHHVRSKFSISCDLKGVRLSLSKSIIRGFENWDKWHCIGESNNLCNRVTWWLIWWVAQINQRTSHSNFCRNFVRFFFYRVNTWQNVYFYELFYYFLKSFNVKMSFQTSYKSILSKMGSITVEV